MFHSIKDRQRHNRDILINIIDFCRLSWVLGLKPIVFMWNLGQRRKCPPCWSFQMTLARIYASFGESQEKLRPVTSINATGDWTWHVLSTGFEDRTVRMVELPPSRFHRWNSQEEQISVEESSVLNHNMLSS